VIEQIVSDNFTRKVWIKVHEDNLMDFIRLYREEAMKSSMFGYFDQLNISASSDMESYHVHFSDIGIKDMDDFLARAGGKVKKKNAR
jgi:hypothetical protein